MLTAALTAPALASTSISHAQPASTQTRNAGHYRFAIGDIKATVITDGLLSGPPSIYASDASKADLRDVLTEAFLPTDRMTLNLNTLLIETGGQKVLIEAGAAQTMGPNGGRLFDNLRAAGVEPDDIDAVVISHTHPDHVGNLRRANGSKAFAKASVHAPEADWNFFVRAEPDLSSLPMNANFRRNFIAAIKRSVEPVATDIVLFQAGKEIVPGLTALAAEGHTPGMVAFLVHSGSDQLLLTADLAYHPLINIDHSWKPGPDLNKEMALQSRRRLFDRAARDRLPVLGFHYPFPGIGNIGKTRIGYKWVAADWRF